MKVLLLLNFIFLVHKFGERERKEYISEAILLLLFILYKKNYYYYYDALLLMSLLQPLVTILIPQKSKKK